MVNSDAARRRNLRSRPGPATVSHDGYLLVSSAGRANAARIPLAALGRRPTAVGRAARGRRSREGAGTQSRVRWARTRRGRAGDGFEKPALRRALSFRAAALILAYSRLEGFGCAGGSTKQTWRVGWGEGQARPVRAFGRRGAARGLRVRQASYGGGPGGRRSGRRLARQDAKRLTAGVPGFGAARRSSPGRGKSGRRTADVYRQVASP